MAFKIKDLMIHVLDPKAAQAGLCRVPSVVCTAPNSLCTFNSHICTAIHSICRFPHTICPPITICETLPTVCHQPFTFCGIPTQCQAHPSLCAIPTICAGGTGCPGGTICAIPSNCGFGTCGALTPCAGGSCGAVPSICAGGSIIPDPTIVENPDPAAGLAALKEQLKQAMANVETQEAALNDSLLPQTVAEVDDLTTRLQGAMDELKARKAELQKRDAKK
jgi:hypothetical protein